MKKTSYCNIFWRFQKDYKPQSVSELAPAPSVVLFSPQEVQDPSNPGDQEPIGHSTQDPSLTSEPGIQSSKMFKYSTIYPFHY